MNAAHTHYALFLFGTLTFCSTVAQEFSPPDRGAPGDEMIQGYLASEANRIHAAFTNDLKSLSDWESALPNYRQEYLYMLGLWPIPDKTPLHATITGTIERDSYVVDLLHYQSRPGLYVTGNLYRPATTNPGERLPAVFYVCGHSNMGRAGNKAAYQSHGIWFARHGYVCLVVDTLQLGEIASIHHGTYRENRWWWHSRGYTPAGVECWNGIRGVDYLVSRADVDPERIAVTGISGGGAATFWIAAADERVKVAVPVSGMADLPSYVNNRVINGHCDCMFFYNTFQWPWTRIAGLIAPRPLLFANSDADRIFPMDANERVIARLERLYSLYGRSDFVDSMVSIGGHAYRQDLRQAAYRFINTHLKDDPRLVQDSEENLATGEQPNRNFPIPVDRLRVFPKKEDIPKDQLNATIDQYFVPIAEVQVPAPGQFELWRSNLTAELRRVTFRTIAATGAPTFSRLSPTEPPMGSEVQGSGTSILQIETEPGIRARLLEITNSITGAGRILLGISDAESSQNCTALLRKVAEPGDALYVCEPRGIGATRWTEKNPPNYVKRSAVLLGSAIDTGRVCDIMVVARALRERTNGKLPVLLVAEGASAILAAYAALLDPEISGLILRNPPLTHMDPAAPQFLNVLRVCDVPDVLGMVAPRPLTVFAPNSPALAKTAAIYDAAGAKTKFYLKME